MSSKKCIACDEEISANAQLCKHCKTMQDDPRFSTNLHETSKRIQKSGSKNSQDIASINATGKKRVQIIWLAVISTVAAISIIALAANYKQLPVSTTVAASTNPTASAEPERDPLGELTTAMHDTKMLIESQGVIETATYADGTITVTVFDPAFMPAGTIIQQTPSGNWDLTNQSGALESGLAQVFFAYIDNDYSPKVFWNKTKRTAEGKLSVPVQWADTTPTYIFTIENGIVSDLEIDIPGSSYYPAELNYQYGTTEAGMKILEKGGSRQTLDFD